MKSGCYFRACEVMSVCCGCVRVPVWAAGGWKWQGRFLIPVRHSFRECSLKGKFPFFFCRKNCWPTSCRPPSHGRSCTFIEFSKIKTHLVSHCMTEEQSCYYLASNGKATLHLGSHSVWNRSPMKTMKTAIIVNLLRDNECSSGLFFISATHWAKVLFPSNVCELSLSWD